jgi:hypothetical protein
VLSSERFAFGRVPTWQCGLGRPAGRHSYQLGFPQIRGAAGSFAELLIEEALLQGVISHLFGRIPLKKGCNRAVEIQAMPQHERPLDALAGNYL